MVTVIFLIDTPIDKKEDVARVLEEAYSTEGFDTADARLLLQDLLAVQNTYLSTFQSLGGLGLVLGTFGLMAVQLRNVWQRRSEIALLRATGFSPSRIKKLVLIEHAILLFGGLGIGIIAALLTVLPHLIFGGASIPVGSTVRLLLIILLVGFGTGSHRDPQHRQASDTGGRCVVPRILPHSSSNMRSVFVC